MDEAAITVSEVQDTEHLVFAPSLMRPWIVANFVACAIGLGMWGGVVRALNEPYYGSAVSAIEAARLQASANGLGGFLMGVALGTAQWLVLRRAIRAGWWIPATCLGFTLAFALVGLNAGGSVSTIGPAAGPVPPLLSLFVITPLAILLPGAGQWLVLRRDCARTGWWPLVNIGAFFGAGFVGLTIAKLLPWIAGTRYPSAQALAVTGLVAGPIYGWLTWEFLAQLRRRSTQQEVA
jgi:hypothetical protein